MNRNAVSWTAEEGAASPDKNTTSRKGVDIPRRVKDSVVFWPLHSLFFPPLPSEGPIDINMSEIGMDAIHELFSKDPAIKLGGHWTPSDCVPRWKVGREVRPEALGSPHTHTRHRFGSPRGLLTMTFRNSCPATRWKSIFIGWRYLGGMGFPK